MERSTKSVEKTTMFEACARTRGDDIREASELLQSIFTRGTLGARIRDAQRFFKAWSGNRVFDLFTGRARRVEGFELDALRGARADKLLRDAAIIREARKAHAEFDAETDRLEAFYFGPDADFYRDQIEARRIASGAVGSPRNAGGDR